MSTTESSVGQFYEGWLVYNERIIGVVHDLSAEEVQVQPGPTGDLSRRSGSRRQVPLENNPYPAHITTALCQSFADFEETTGQHVRQSLFVVSDAAGQLIITRSHPTEPPF